jgi:hypothetical protein
MHRGAVPDAFGARRRFEGQSGATSPDCTSFARPTSAASSFTRVLGSSGNSPAGLACYENLPYDRQTGARAE